MKPAAMAIGAGFALAASAALTPWTLTGVDLRARLVHQAREVADLKSDLPGKVVFSLLPRPRVKVEDISFENRRNGLSVSAASLKANLDLFDLALGKIAFSSITLYQPEIDVDIDRWPDRGGGAIAVERAGVGSVRRALANARLASIHLLDGRVYFRSPQRRFVVSVQHMDAKLDWKSASAPASLTASGVWRGRTAAVDAWLGDPLAFLRGGSSPLKISAAADLVSAKFDGAAFGGADWRLDGQIETSSPALRPLADWILDAPSAIPRAFGETSLSGRLSVDPKGLSLSNLSFTGGGSDFEGEAALRLTSQRPLLAATLASSSLSLTPFLDGFPPMVDGSGAWSLAPFQRDLGPLDLDLRLSATRAKLARLDIEDLGLAVLLHGNRLDVSLPEAKLYGGDLQAEASVVNNARDETFVATGGFTNVETSGLLWDADNSDVLNGPASGDFSVTAQGDCVDSLVRSLTGDAKFSVKSGEVVGLDFEQALRRIEKRPLSVAAEIHGGSTSFDQFAGAFHFADDRAKLKDVQISGPGAQVALTGSTLLGERALDVTATARQAGSDGTLSPGGSTLSFKVEGYWDQPRLVLDAESLMRRSEAAAPLFDQSPSTLQAQQAP